MATYKLRDLARLTGVTPRAIRFYMEHGLLPRPPFRAAATAYGVEHLARLRAILRLQKQERLRLPVIKRRLAKLSDEAIAALAAPPPKPDAAEKRDGGADGGGVVRRAALDAGEAIAAGGWAAQRWERIELVAGLELHLCADAPPLLVRLAQEIHALYGAAMANGARDAGNAGSVAS